MMPLIVPFTCTLLGDLPCGRGRQELGACGTLAVAAVASVINEGPHNLQPLTWDATIQELAVPVVFSALCPRFIRVPCPRLRCSGRPPPPLVHLQTPQR